MNKYDAIYIIKYWCFDAISIFKNLGAISYSLPQIDTSMMGTFSVKSHNNNDANMPLMCDIQLFK